MNKKILGIALFSVLALTACGAQAEAEPDATETPTATETTREPVVAPSVTPIERETTPEPEPTEEGSEVNARGNFVSELGNVGELVTGSGEVALSFTVDDIQPSVCTAERAELPENGHFYTISMTVESTGASPDLDIPTNPAAFDFISEDGTTFNGELGTNAAYRCLPEQETLPSYVGPGEKVTGSVVVDVPATTGILVYDITYGQTEAYEFSF